MDDRKNLNRELDKLASEIVRHREKRCFTCGKWLPYSRRQAGHYVPRCVLASRWDLRNLHAQCNRCNVELGGNLGAYREKLPQEDLAALDAIWEDYKQARSKKMTLAKMEEIRQKLLAVHGKIK